MRWEIVAIKILRGPYTENGSDGRADLVRKGRIIKKRGLFFAIGTLTLAKTFVF